MHIRISRGEKCYQVTCTPRVGIPTSCGAFSPHVGHSHFTRAFSPCMDMLTSHGAFSPHMGIFTLCGAFSPHMDIFTLCGEFSPSVCILSMCGHFHLVWGIFTWHEHSHLICTLHARHTSCAPPHHHYVSHLTYTLPLQQTSHLACSPSHKNNIFHLKWKNFQNSDKAIPITSIRYPYELPIKVDLCVEVRVVVLLTINFFVNNHNTNLTSLSTTSSFILNQSHQKLQRMKICNQ